MTEVLFAQGTPVPTANPDHLTPAEIQDALASRSKKGHAELLDMGAIFAHDLTGGAGHGVQIPSLDLYMPEAWLRSEAESARKQYKAFQPSAEDTLRALTIIAKGLSSTKSETDDALSGPTCNSVTRVVLINGKNGEAVAEAVNVHLYDATVGNIFGATAPCSFLMAKFLLSDVERVEAAAPKGEFLVALFSGATPLKFYKIKKYDLKELGLESPAK